MTQDCKHTPGPWEVSRSAGMLSGVDSPTARIAEWRGIPDGMTAEEHEANRSLIAAAPETAAERDRLADALWLAERRQDRLKEQRNNLAEQLAVAESFALQVALIEKSKDRSPGLPLRYADQFAAALDAALGADREVHENISAMRDILKAESKDG